MDSQVNDKNNNNGLISLNSKFLFIRHSATYFNLDKSQSRYFNLSYQNCPLSPQGIELAKSKSSIINDIDIEIVYCSPHYRALETTFYLLENHKNKDKFVVKVHPLLCENINCIHDFLFNVTETKQKFNMNSKVKFDWSIFDDFCKGENENLFTLKFMDNVKDREKYFSRMTEVFESEISQEEKKKIIEQELKKLTEYVNEKKRLESLQHVEKRIEELKKYFIDLYLNKINLDDDKKIIIVGHSTYYKLFTKKNYVNYDGYTMNFSDGIMLNNCEIGNFNII